MDIGPLTLDQTDIYASFGQVVRAGATFPVTICSSDDAVGTITGGVATASAAGTSCATTEIPAGEWRGLDLEFDPNGEGVTEVAPAIDPAYAPSEAGQQTVIVN